ncbi:Sterol desaturase [Sandaracinus amylolyticus]|uniref:Sterol desaturase n=2 Tax=Sandaracinus amylolyticus TaxID=927083 RepID=A0A0F6YFZ7_9BACT|nr:Sterol desaturase [Sandaracinus amylolyticus]
MMLLAYSIYPLLWGGSVVTLVVAMSAGVPYPWIGPPLLIGVALAVAALERLQPHAREWLRDRGDRRTDVAHFVANVAVSQGSLALLAALAPVRAMLPSAWPGAWPLALQVVIATLVVDLGLYAIHRASHVVPALWRLHAIHHSAERIYWVNGQRRHVVHELLEGAPGLLLLFALGAPVSIIAAAIAVVTLHLFFQHANVEYRLGPLRHVFAVAEVHRWHHQRRYEDVQGNYAAVFALWDHLFGTALPKQGDAPLDVGLEEHVPRDFVGQLRWPFRVDSFQDPSRAARHEHVDLPNRSETR